MLRVTATATFKQNKNIIRFYKKVDFKRWTQKMKYNNRILVNYLSMLLNGVNKYLIEKQNNVQSFKHEYCHLELKLSSHNLSCWDDIEWT